MKELRKTWLTHDNTELPISDMEDSHLVNTIVHQRAMIDQAVNYQREHSHSGALVRTVRMASTTDNLMALCYEAGRRGLELPVDTDAPDPAGFDGKTRTRRRRDSQASRANRDLNM